MYPSIVDMNENESSKYLRMLELDAYANILAALRAQGPPTSDKLKLLKDIGAALRIPQERCKAEIRKVILDERLNTIAYLENTRKGNIYVKWDACAIQRTVYQIFTRLITAGVDTYQILVGTKLKTSCGQLETSDEWIKEGRRLISLMPRVAPQTIYSAIADEVADAASISNEQLPLPAHTDRKRSIPPSQVQCNVPESTKSQQFRIPDAFKSEDSKKRKLPFGVENSSLAQHLIAPSKVSRIQQIYRQKVKAAAKEDQLKAKIKQEPEQHEYRHIHPQTRVLHQQHYQPKVQKLPLTVQSTASASPKINILQNISIQPPNRGEETIEQIKNEINNFITQKGAEPNRSSPQPGCSNENQAPKQTKQTVVNIKPNANITYKHVASPGPSSELQKSLKVCPTRKPITKTIPGQKLIIVSNAQSIATSSILQRTLTIPFVKNISVKNFDKFKIVSTSTNTPNLQLTSLANANASAFATSSAKHKVVTVRTNPTTKKMIPLAHLHALNARGSIKVLPVGGKILAKTTTTATTSSLFVMNNVGGIQQALTKSTSSTPVIMTCRPQDSAVPSEVKVMQSLKSEEGASQEESTSIETLESTESTNLTANTELSNNQEAAKSSVLADILKASGLTAIPQTVPETIMDDEVHTNENDELLENSEMVECQDVEDSPNNGKDRDTDRLLKDLEGEDSSDVVIGNLDPGTGEYTIETSESQCENESKSTVLSENTFEVELQNSNMPDINAIN